MQRFVQALHQRVDVFSYSIHVEAGACSCGQAEAFHQWLCAVVPGAHCDSVLIEHLGHIMRMDTVEIEGQDSDAPLTGAEQLQPRNGRQPVDAITGQRVLVESTP